MKKSQVFVLMPLLLLFLTIMAMPAHAAAGDGSLAVTTDACDPTVVTSIQYKLREATRVYTQGAISNAREEFERQPRTDIGKGYCLDRIMGFFNTALAMTDILGLAVGFFTGLLSNLLNLACELVVTGLEMAVQLAKNVVSLMCIPLPNLNFGLGMPGLAGRSCGGVPLATLPSGSPYYLPPGQPLYYNNMSRGIPRVGGGYGY